MHSESGGDDDDDDDDELVRERWNDSDRDLTFAQILAQQHIYI